MTNYGTIQNITTHLAYGNGYDAVTVCGRLGIDVINVVSVLDYNQYSDRYRFCRLCLDLYLFGRNRGAVKGTIVRRLTAKINHAIRMAERYSNWKGWGMRLENYCDLAHKHEVDLIEVLTTDAYELLMRYRGGE